MREKAYMYLWRVKLMKQGNMYKIISSSLDIPIVKPTALLLFRRELSIIHQLCLKNLLAKLLKN